MGVEARLQPSHPPALLTGSENDSGARLVFVKRNATNTVVIPHDPEDPDASRWAFATNAPDSQPPRRQAAGNEVVYFVDGAEAFPQFQCEIEKASGEGDFIYLVGWYLDVDLTFPNATSSDGSTQVGKTMREMLTAAGKRKVQIRVMLDAEVTPDQYSSNRAAIDFINFGLEEGAGPAAPPKPNPPPPYEWVEAQHSVRNPEYDKYMAAYNEKYKNELKACEDYRRGLRRGNPDHPDSLGVLDDHYAPVGTHHQKILLIMHAGKLTAFVGGMDMNGDRINAVQERHDPQHDVHCRIRGPASNDVLQIFLDRWHDFMALPVPKNPPESMVSVWRTEIDRMHPLRGDAAPVQPSCGTHAVQIARTFGQIVTNPYRFAPMGERSIAELIHTGIRQARRFIYIEDQYLVNLEVAGWLSLALSHIERLIILVPPPEYTTPGSYVDTREQFIGKLRAAAPDKVEVYCLNKTSDTCGIYVHAKTWIFDDKLAVIGSANCNNRGLRHDSEVSAGIYDPSSNACLTYTLAHRLRMRLWAHHLGLAEAELADGVASAVHWKYSDLPGTRVVPYDQAPGWPSVRAGNSGRSTATAGFRALEKNTIGWWLSDTW